PGPPAPGPRPAPSLPGAGRAPGPGRARRDARADGRGRCLRVSLAVRGLGRRHLRGPGLRPAPGGHAQRRLGRPRPHRGLRGRAERMERLGNDPELRAAMAEAARARALDFDWPRYHASLVDLVLELLEPGMTRAPDNAGRLALARSGAAG